MISIIIPVYNVEKYLKKCIDSILMQSYTDYEVILIDDGSTDSSGTLCDNYQSNARFRIIHQTNKGVSSARNKGLSIAAGEYILFVDPDDWLSDNALEIIMREIGDADLLMFNYYSVHEKNDNTTFLKRNTNSIYSTKHIVKNPFWEILGNSGVIWNKLFKRSVIRNTFFNIGMSYGEDMIFLAKTLHNVQVSKIIPDCLYYYFQNRNGNVCSASIGEKSIEYLKNTKDLFEICSKNNCSTVGIKRISTSIRIVISKIPLHEIKKNKIYIDECKSLLRIPSCFDYLKYFTDKKITFQEKKATACLFLGLFFPYLRLIKHTLFQ